jgi:cytochrome c553
MLLARRPFARRLLAASGLATAALANAQEMPGRLGLCAACHGERGVATTPEIPHLAGQNLAYLRNAMEQYRSGARDVPAMRAAVGMLQAVEIDEILRWYAQQKPQERAAQ